MSLGGAMAPVSLADAETLGDGFDEADAEELAHADSTLSSRADTDDED